MIKFGLLAIVTALLSACATTPLDIQHSELNEARTLIAKAKAAGAERCAPKLQAKAVADLYMAAHEYNEGNVHPQEQADLVTSSTKAAKEAYRTAKNNCGAKPKPKPKPKPQPQKVEVIALKGVYFETNSDTLTAASVATLNNAVTTLQKRASIRVEVAAHTDSRGSAVYNRNLSNRRANSVMNYLIEHGINAARLSAKGYGEVSPIADNATVAGRAENRRVELRVQ